VDKIPILYIPDSNFRAFARKKKTMAEEKAKRGRLSGFFAKPDGITPIGAGASENEDSVENSFDSRDKGLTFKDSLDATTLNSPSSSPGTMRRRLGSESSTRQDSSDEPE